MKWFDAKNKEVKDTDRPVCPKCHKLMEDASYMMMCDMKCFDCDISWWGKVGFKSPERKLQDDK